jgi:transcriptional regulator with XRE-family HTH domain
MIDTAAVVCEAQQRTGLSLERLAERVGSTGATLSRVHSGRVDPSWSLMQRVLSVAGMNVRAEGSSKTVHADFG